MSLVSEELKACSVRIRSEVSGVPVVGTGLIYQTPSIYSYNYVLTATHLLSEDSHTEFNFSKVNNIEIDYYTDKFERLCWLPTKQLKKEDIICEGDFAIIKIPKNEGINFPAILVCDSLADKEINFSCWSIFRANEESLNSFKFSRDDPSEKRITLESKVTRDYLNGISGSGIFIHNKNILYGIVSKYSFENFEKSTIECAKISFASINSKLHNAGLVQLDTTESRLKRDINGKIVELYQASINGAYLNLDLAIERTRADMRDDWFYDPLQYIDLLNRDYLYAQLKDNFYKKNYACSKAEKFYVPKSNFTLREAFILPFKDRIIYMAIVGELAELMDDSLISNVFSSRYNRINKNLLLINGVEQWQKLKYKIAQELHEKENDDYKYNCILKIDILNYYDNIDKKLIIKKLKRIANSPNHIAVIELLKSFLFGYSKKSSGLPQNNEASALLSTFYLNQVDNFMANHTQSYYRFADDIRILCKDRYEARKYLVLLEKELKRCHLSVNSQKTKIIEISDSEEAIKNDFIKLRSDYREIFNQDIELIDVLSKSSNYQYRNEAFHSAIRILEQNINSDAHENKEQSRNLTFALRIIEKLGKSKIHIQTHQNDLFKALLQAVYALKDKPWITPQICKILSLLDVSEFTNSFAKELKDLVLNNKYNLYPYQQFQIWLLFAKQLYKSNDLVRFASQKIEINDTTQKATVAAQILYLGSVDKNFKRILLRKFEEGFTNGYFQDRATLIALRSYNLVTPVSDKSHPTLSKSFPFTSKFGHKELVFYKEVESNFEDSDTTEELFSI